MLLLFSSPFYSCFTFSLLMLKLFFISMDLELKDLMLALFGFCTQIFSSPRALQFWGRLGSCTWLLLSLMMLNWFKWSFVKIWSKTSFIIFVLSIWLSVLFSSYSSGFVMFAF